MSDLTQLFNNIKKELEFSPSRKVITSYLLSISKEDFGPDYFDLVGSTFQLNPEFFMKSVYPSFRKKLAKIVGGQKIGEMERFILEKFCLYQGEEILYERTGSIQELLSRSYKKEVLNGILFVTTHRIIVQGRFRFAKLTSRSPGMVLIGPVFGDPFGRYQRRTGPGDLTKTNPNASKKELPCYGYNFPIKFISNLKYNNRRVTYEIDYDGWIYKYKLSLSSSKSQSSLETLVNILQSKVTE